MMRLNTFNMNTPALSDRIFAERWDYDIHTEDQERFDQLASRFQGGKYLDVGCFNSPKPGQLAEIEGNEIHALDYAPNVIQVMQRRFPKVHYRIGDCYHLPYSGNYFDYVVAGEIIEHLEEIRKFTDEVIRVLKPEGTLAISTPHMENILQPMVSDEHLWSFHETDMEILFGDYGEVDIEFYQDTVTIMIVFVRKR